MKPLSHYGLDDGPFRFARIPVLFIVDTSSGTLTTNKRGQKNISKLYNVFEGIREEMGNNWELDKGVDVSLLTFGRGVSVMQDFRPVKEWDDSEIPLPTVGGQGSMSRAIMEGLRNLEEYRRTIDHHGFARRTAHVWIMTHNGSIESNTAEWDTAQNTLATAANDERLYVYPTAFGDRVEMKTLENLVINVDDQYKAVIKVGEGQLDEFVNIVYRCIKPDIVS